jgi:hypothetical protein
VVTNGHTQRLATANGGDAELREELRRLIIEELKTIIKG